MTGQEEGYVTLVTSDSYTVGALVLGHSLKKTGTTKSLICLVGQDVSEQCRLQLSAIFRLIQINTIDSKDEVNLELLGRPELGITFSKLYIWTLTFLRKAVFLDADTLVLKNVDELFEREEFSACPDIGWPDCFNSGVFVCKPAIATFNDLLHLAGNVGSFDGGDQGLLNTFFSSWSTGDSSRRIPFVYNLTVSASYSYAPAFQKFKNDARIIHFIGAHKPWLFNRFTTDGGIIPHPDVSKEALELIQQWWNIHDEYVPSKPGYTIMPSYAQQDFLRQYVPPVVKYENNNTPVTAEIDDFASYRVHWNKDVEYSVSQKMTGRSANSLPPSNATSRAVPTSTATNLKPQDNAKEVKKAPTKKA